MSASTMQVGDIDTAVSPWRTDFPEQSADTSGAQVATAPEPITRSGFEIRHIVTSQIASL